MAQEEDEYRLQVKRKTKKRQKKDKIKDKRQNTIIYFLPVKKLKVPHVNHNHTSNE
jgi:hypothetical protein